MNSQNNEGTAEALPEIDIPVIQLLCAILPVLIVLAIIVERLV